MSGIGAPVVEPVDAAGLTLGIVATTRAIADSGVVFRPPNGIGAFCSVLRSDLRVIGRVASAALLSIVAGSTPLTSTCFLPTLPRS